MKIKWDLEHVYFYLVSFVSLILIIIGAVTLTQTAISYVTPVYGDYGPYGPIGRGQETEQWEERFGTEFVEAEMERYDLIMKENYGRQLVRDLVRGISFIIIALPVYFYHWRKIPQLEAAESENETNNGNPS
jgi:hypothetical protein